MAKQLSDEGINAIKTNSDLYAAVAKELRIAPQSLHSILYLKKRSRRFMEIGVLKLIAAFLNVEVDSLIVEIDADCAVTV